MPPRRSKPRSKRAKPNDGRERLLQAFVEHSPVGIALLDRTAKVVQANAAFARILGFAVDEATGRRITDLNDPEDAAAISSLVRRVGSRPRDNGAVETRFIRQDGEVVWGALTVSSTGKKTDGQLVAVLHDVTERKALEAKLVHEATHDALTQLPNRVLFRERVEHSLARCARKAERSAVIFLDLDAFKGVNDTQGHDAGDSLLKVVAQRLLSATRGCDTVARLGGDEFAILLEQVDALAGAEAAVARIMCALRQPIEFENNESVTVTASYGIAVYSGIEQGEDLLRNADVAMYEAKHRARGRWVIFDPAMQEALSERVTLEGDLRRAVKQYQLRERPGLENTGVFAALDSRPLENELTVCYQPIVDLRSGQITSIEALARWTHPTRGEISPDQFIAIAELSGVVVPLGACVLRDAVKQAARWRATYGDSPSVTVNLSGSQLEHDGIAAEIDAVLREAQLAPAQLVLEITETAIMQNAETMLARLHDLKGLGVGLAIDDFGTGYSSLSYLQRLPVDIVKIDQLFTRDLRDGDQGIAFMRTIIALARALNLRTVAEGVEDELQRQLLSDLGCEAGQGYLLGRPVTAREISALLSTVAAGVGAGAGAHDRSR
jgi:diguanylate cyclase (GGDEF)-like protein/PAS domain S-box-containing protein